MEPETTTTRGFWGPAGVLPQKRFVFLGSLNLISCNFSTIFSIFIFRQKRTFNLMDRGKAKTFSEGQHRGWLGWGRSFSPSSIYLKKALWETSNVSEFVTETFLLSGNIENHIHEYFRNNIS